MGRQPEPLVRAEVEEIVRRFCERHQPVGMLVGVRPPAEQPGAPLWLMPYGTTRQGPVVSLPEPRTVWQIGSITKTVTATLLAWATVRGEIELSEQVQRYAPAGIELPAYVAWLEDVPIRFLDLATHTAGLPEDPRGVPKVGGYSPQQMYDYLNAYALAVEPGTSWNYSNLGFGLLANSLQRVAGGETFQTMVDQLKAFAELPMPDTVLHPNEDQRQRRAFGYAQRDAQHRSKWKTDTWPAFDGSGALYSTLDDLLVWLDFNLRRRASPADCLLPLTQQVYYQQPGHTMGLAWEGELLSDGTFAWSNTGATTGFTSHLALSHPHDVGVVILCNSIWILPQVLGREILEVFARSTPAQEGDGR